MSQLQRRVLDAFSKSLLPRAAGSGIPLATVNRHLPVLRSCVGATDTALMIARCSRTLDPIGITTPTSLLLLTRRRLVITGESRILHRLHLYLNENLAHLAHVNWVAEPTQSAVRLAVTAMDGVREHFWIAMSGANEVARVTAVLQTSFPTRHLTAA